MQDQNVVDQIIGYFNPKPDQAVVEIGAGRGALSFPLLEKLDSLHVLELDHGLSGFLSAQKKNTGKLYVHQCDALEYDFSEIAKNNLRILGNLPYKISTPLIFHLLKFHYSIDDMLFMLQEEVVNRICAQPGSKKYGRLSVMVQTYCQVEKIFTVSPAAFTPRPKVMSAIVRLVPHNIFLSNISNQATFSKLVRIVFSKRRKTLKNCLKGLIDITQIQDCNIVADMRPEMLDVNSFIKLANSYHQINRC